MALTLQHKVLCCVLWETPKTLRAEKIQTIIQYVEIENQSKIINTEVDKVNNFIKLFELKMKSVNYNIRRFQSKFATWLECFIEIKTTNAGAPCKSYEDLGDKSKKMRLSDILSTHSDAEVKDSFKEVLRRNKQPAEATQIADILPDASPKRLKRIVKSIPTPSPESEFSEDEAIALMLELGLSKNKYIKLRKALSDKGCSILPGYNALWDTKKTIIPSPIEVTNDGAIVELPAILENTAIRLLATFSRNQAKELNKSNLTLICKWGCDGLSTLPEYKQVSGTHTTSDYKSVFMASLVPLRLRNDSIVASTSANSINYVWRNKTPGSKAFCRPIRFQYLKENKSVTKDWVDSINRSIENLHPLCIEIHGYYINIQFELQLTMIDGKVCNAITETDSAWKCFLCGMKKSEFSKISDDTPSTTSINKDVLQFGISPLHARIRFLEHMLHIAYDLKYRSIPGNQTKMVRNNKELMEMRANEKRRIQEEFKEITGLNIDKPLIGYGSTNDGNTARRFFQNYEITSTITGINEELLRRCHVILSAINSKNNINGDKFESYAKETFNLLRSLYEWRELTPTVHKVLRHGREIIESNLLPLGELTEEAQEARNSDFKHILFFNTRKCSRQSQNEDLINYLMLSSDPVLSSIRKKWSRDRNLSYENEELKEVLDLFDVNEYIVEIK